MLFLGHGRRFSCRSADNNRVRSVFNLIINQIRKNIIIYRFVRVIMKRCNDGNRGALEY